MRKLAGPLPVDATDMDGIHDACALCVLPGKRGIGFGGQEQMRHRVAAPQQGQGFDEVFPALVSIEVASVEANVGAVGQAERAPCFTPRRARRGR